MKSQIRIGLLGTGLMGQPVARRLAAAGYSVAVWNRSSEKALPLTRAGIMIKQSSAQLLADSDVIICLLSDAIACDQVIFNQDALHSVGKNTTIIMMSTLSPDIVVEQARKASSVQAHYIDMPVSGGTIGAEKGSLSLMAGGDRKIVDSLRPLLSHLGKVTHIGGVGAGQLTKLANQIIVAGTLSLLSEAFTLAQQGGADPAKVREALLGGFADSTLLQHQGERMVKGDFEARGAAKWQLKDTRSAVALAKQLDLTLPLTETVNQLFSQMIDAGEGELDHCAIIKQIQRLNNVLI
ncbi:NAD(P)-dependent oxidoreductase [Leclercia adecarboxylata]|uniref:NAD(P)-dependent oxidoreductase n=1 Tax=Leclercia adecarboxylata TaxID=83655 RepID=A0ABU6I6K1_9ENTR|nr:NAD(P)-dependent oxidoreductase [Leclercia adecarboxylata]MBZ3801544.1 NAD(P)-dependent oxidoreductase [Leclercia adecarboxylata]MBZ3806042.1 NAD(P)-dependent oxidoreductase [Leclercia adecarboxylata]MDV5238778.1 NAD(P)-dependent oxidoreductase [Leclercia adecarboxylata]MDV5279640.1 NAD(P)-dependent oxidoreductase [Leclercia adecarboxylata]MDV5462099.1 NAD(P)-dependent oxidoreductase [Leclercia adecarboxylata]